KQAPGSPAELLARNSGYGGKVATILANPPELEKIQFALALRNLRYGWTLDQRKKYFKWFESARGKSGGASYGGFINNIHKEAMANVSPAELKALKATVIQPPPKTADLPKPKGPGRDWKLTDLLALTDSGLTGRSFENGKRAFGASRCVVCHRFDGEGGATGPDLSNAAGRFSKKDLSEAIVDPSKVISDQYRAHVVLTRDGKTITGRILGEQDGKLTILIDPEDGTKIVTIAKDDVEQSAPSMLSLMPTALLKTLGKEEVLDLFAYLLSRGNPDDLMFKK
ncbi:MAG: c-type cytochrome, partial [Planctomycetales bacterium]